MGAIYYESLAAFEQAETDSRVGDKPAAETPFWRLAHDYADPGESGLQFYTFNGEQHRFVREVWGECLLSDGQWRETRNDDGTWNDRTIALRGTAPSVPDEYPDHDEDEDYCRMAGL